MARLLDARSAALLALLLSAGCASRKPRTDHGIEDLGALLAEGGAEPVRGQLVDGVEPLEPRADREFATPEEAERVLQERAQDEAQEDPQPASHPSPYIRFGERIIPREDANGVLMITKPYTLPAGKAEKLVALIGAMVPFPFKKRPPVDETTGVMPPLDPFQVTYETLPGWDVESYADLSLKADFGKPPAQTNPVALSDLMVVTATYERLEEFEEFLDVFASAGIPQVELEAKIIEIVEADQFDLGTESTFDFGGRNFLRGVDFTLPGITSGAGALLDIGAVQNTPVFNATLQAIKTWDNVQIDSRPKTVVRAGGVAYLDSTTEIPYFEIKSLDTAGNFSTTTLRQKVGVQLYISPEVIGTRTLALDVHLVGSQQVGSQATFTAGNTVIDAPVIASRTAKTTVYLEPGQTLLIGGLTTTRERELINKIPVLGDLPLLGLLFRSKFTRTDKQSVLFAISPRILQNSDFEAEF